ncbi:MAG: phage tail protein [Gammaproteobacteria bacterium]
MQAYIGQITMAGFNFPPRDWSFCDGAILPIAQNQALFSLLGTQFGGDGRTTLGLPDLRGRAPVHPGGGLFQGGRGGYESVHLTTQDMAAHRHLIAATSDTADRGVQTGAETLATGSAPGGAAAGTPYSSSTSSQVPMAAGLLDIVGGNSGVVEAHPNVQPSQCINFIVALEGLYPSRN